MISGFMNQDDDIAEEEEDIQVNQHPMTTRAKAGIHKPNSRYALVALKMVPKTPKNIEEASNHPGWNLAVFDEINTIHMLNTFTLVPPTEDMNILGCRWVLHQKCNQKES